MTDIPVQPLSKHGPWGQKDTDKHEYEELYIYEQLDVKIVYLCAIFIDNFFNYKYKSWT